MSVPQSMVKKVVLPLCSFMRGQIPFPAADNPFHTRVFWKGNDGVNVIRHQQHQPTMPFEVLMVEPGRGKDRVTSASMAQLIPAANFAVDRDEEEAALLNPERHFMRKMSSRCEPHAKSCAKTTTV